jgi:hypothetical protein
VVHEVIGALADVAKIENPPKNEGKQRIVCLLAPKPKEKAEQSGVPRPQPAAKASAPVAEGVMGSVQTAGNVSANERAT